MNTRKTLFGVGDKLIRVIVVQVASLLVHLPISKPGCQCRGAVVIGPHVLVLLGQMGLVMMEIARQPRGGSTGLVILQHAVTARSAWKILLAWFVIPDRRVAGRVPFPADRERRVVPTVVIHGVGPAIMGPAVLLLTEDGRVVVCVR